MEDQTLPRATIAPIVLDGEPTTDRAFRCGEDGRTYRVRLQPVDVTTGEGVVIAFLRAFDLTVIRLDAKKRPERNAAGQVVIVANTRWTVDAQAAAGELSLDEQLDLLVANLIHTASFASAAPAALDAMLAGWGIDPVTAATVEEPPAPAPLPQSLADLAAAREPA